MAKSPTKIDLDVRINGIPCVATANSQRSVALQSSGPQLTSKPSSSVIGRPSAAFKELLRRGVIRPGDPLHWYRPASRDVYVVWVTDAGTLRDTSGVEYASPSAAAQGVSGISTNGLDAWIDFRTGKSLNDLHA